MVTNMSHKEEPMFEVMKKSPNAQVHAIKQGVGLLPWSKEREPEK